MGIRRRGRIFWGRKYYQGRLVEVSLKTSDNYEAQKRYRKFLQSLDGVGITEVLTITDVINKVSQIREHSLARNTLARDKYLV